MKSYLTHLYEMDLHENETKPVTSASAKEDELYTKLEQTLPLEQFLTVMEFTKNTPTEWRKNVKSILKRVSAMPFGSFLNALTKTIKEKHYENLF